MAEPSPGADSLASPSRRPGTSPCRWAHLSHRRYQPGRAIHGEGRRVHAQGRDCQAGSIGS